MNWKRCVYAPLVLLALVLFVSACGGGSDGTASSGEPTAGSPTDAPVYGTEAPMAVREEASVALSRFMAARQFGEYEKQCALMSKVGRQNFEESVGQEQPALKGKGCTSQLTALASEVPASVRENNMTGSIDSFQLKGNKGQAYYHGKKGVDYIMGLTKEGSRWGVDFISPGEVETEESS